MIREDQVIEHITCTQKNIHIFHESYFSGIHATHLTNEPYNECTKKSNCKHLISSIDFVYIIIKTQPSFYMKSQQIYIKSI